MPVGRERLGDTAAGRLSRLSLSPALCRACYTSFSCMKPLLTTRPLHLSASPCSAARSEHFDFAVVATGLFNQPVRPEWAEGLAIPAPPPADVNTPWIVDVKEFTDEQLPLAQVIEEYSSITLALTSRRPKTMQLRASLGLPHAAAVQSGLALPHAVQTCTAWLRPCRASASSSWGRASRRTTWGWLPRAWRRQPLWWRAGDTGWPPRKCWVRGRATVLRAGRQSRQGIVLCHAIGGKASILMSFCCTQAERSGRPAGFK